MKKKLLKLFLGLVLLTVPIHSFSQINSFKFGLAVPLNQRVDMYGLGFKAKTFFFPPDLEVAYSCHWRVNRTMALGFNISVNPYFLDLRSLPNMEVDKKTFCVFYTGPTLVFYPKGMRFIFNPQIGYAIKTGVNEAYCARFNFDLNITRRFFIGIAYRPIGIYFENKNALPYTMKPAFDFKLGLSFWWW
ncbi:MAG: hypothetical protein LBH22_06445 [Bacteroidales bacterium]|jgi:hypothetical protein|nr:hypothetical protein [Bacteroidales bacterium]